MLCSIESSAFATVTENVVAIELTTIDQTQANRSIILTGYKDAPQWQSLIQGCDLALNYLLDQNSADNMHLIAISRLREAAAKFPDIAAQIEDWNEIVKVVTWQNLNDPYF